MKRLLFLELGAVFLAAAAPCSILAQSPPAAHLGPPAAKPRPLLVLPATSAAALTPKGQNPQPQTDLLAGVRSQVSRLRSVPIPSGSKSLHENSAQKAAEEVKVLHNWKGDPASAGWTFSVGKSK